MPLRQCSQCQTAKDSIAFFTVESWRCNSCCGRRPDEYEFNKADSMLFLQVAKGLRLCKVSGLLLGLGQLVAVLLLLFKEGLHEHKLSHFATGLACIILAVLFRKVELLFLMIATTKGSDLNLLRQALVSLRFGFLHQALAMTCAMFVAWGTVIRIVGCWEGVCSFD
eukprot:NODE_5525_length_644_cov_3.634429_g5361_i0.p1 GENE.NODE_5525_length_644_cov_3.634429_g5361_i0~~NODE_5525_length_644_cov_3.634429_g5361_i0.p1  ORF type:complete len:181 (+),score=46.66 NODE_5525_length_644_cov_3.634429_g5361_i0:43-543(+)